MEQTILSFGGKVRVRQVNEVTLAHTFLSVDSGGPLSGNKPQRDFEKYDIVLLI